MTASTTSTTPIPQATPAQQRALCRLRERYQHDQDLFTRQELARLAFVRWLYQTGRVQP
jgi:hypothetical protein